MSGNGPSRDCIIVGASFAGLACAMAIAGRGFSVRVLEKRAGAAEKIRTTGIIVRDAVDHIALLDDLPQSLTRAIPAVRLHAPNLKSVRLVSPGYYFLATDTPGVMRWLAAKAEAAGAQIQYRVTFQAATPTRGGWDLGEHGRCRFLVGADGARSAVACALGLGANRRLLHGIEYEYRLGTSGPTLSEPDALQCFVNRDLAPGYIAWLMQGVDHIQAGLARRGQEQARGLKAAMQGFLARIESIAPLAGLRPDSVRAGAIPCGGPVRPLSTHRALLVGDAAGMVSPLTAGGIHTALRYGLAAGHAVADFLEGRSLDPAGQLIRSYPRFRVKRILRLGFDHLQSDWVFNALLSTHLARRIARQIYFHR